MKFRSQVDTWLDDKSEAGMREYFRLMGQGPYEIDVHASGEFISEKLRRYMFGLVRLIMDFHREELGDNDITIRDILHEIEDTLNPQYDIVVYSDGTPIKKWYNREALSIKDQLQYVYGPRGLYLPDPAEGYDETS